MFQAEILSDRKMTKPLNETIHAWQISKYCRSVNFKAISVEHTKVKTLDWVFLAADLMITTPSAEAGVGSDRRGEAVKEAICIWSLPLGNCTFQEKPFTKGLWVACVSCNAQWENVSLLSSCKALSLSLSLFTFISAAPHS